MGLAKLWYRLSVEVAMRRSSSKLIALICLLLGLLIAVPVLARPVPAHTAAAAATTAPPNAYVLRVNGLACPFCAFGIEKEFSRQPGVENTNVDLSDGVLIVTVKPGTRFTDAQLNKIVKDAGFVLKRVVRRPTGTAP